MPILKLEYPIVVLLRELAVMEIDSCIASARQARLKAYERGDTFSDPSIALRYEQRASLLLDFLDAIESCSR